MKDFTDVKFIKASLKFIADNQEMFLFRYNALRDCLEIYVDGETTVDPFDFLEEVGD